MWDRRAPYWTCCPYCHNTLDFVQEMLIGLVYPSRVIPLVPEQMRTYPSTESSHLRAPGAFKPNYFWGHTGDDYYV